MRLVDADELLKHAYWECFDDPDMDYKYVLKSDIDAAPTIYPKTGRWILVQEADETGNALYECSNCHKGEVHVPIVEVCYCWNCGAKMDKKEN